MTDNSVSQNWFIQPTKRNKYQVYSPKKLPTTLTMQDDFCELHSKQTLLLTGKFNSKISEESISPQIIFKINKTTEILHIDFRHASSGKASKYFCLVKI